jgi:isopenicillin N synthase-like dioxygenase
MSLPSLDLERLEAGADGTESKRLRTAARDTGAFFLTGHGVDAGIIDALLDTSRAFFALPQTDRDAIDMIHSPYFRGYSALGTERTQSLPDMREQLDVGPEESPHARAEPAWLRLHGPNLWPAAQPSLRPAILVWMERQRAVSIRLARVLAHAIGMPRDTFDDGFSGQPHERLKIINYPATDGAAPQGVGEHSDSGFITLIVDDGARGLQVETGAAFADVVTKRGDIIVMFGRALQSATEHAVHAPRHRVMAPPNANERISIAYFLNPRLDYAGYGAEALAVVLRSHPQTARRFFSDLLPA